MVNLAGAAWGWDWGRARHRSLEVAARAGRPCALLARLLLIGGALTLALIAMLWSFTGPPPPRAASRELQQAVLARVYGGAGPGRESLFSPPRPRNRLLVLSYSTHSPVPARLAANPALFLLNVNARLAETKQRGLELGWTTPGRTATLATLSLVRNVFDCEKENSSALLSKAERAECVGMEWRAVVVSHLAVRHLEPVLQRYRAQLRVVLVLHDPRGLVIREAAPARVICRELLTDLQRLQEFGAGEPGAFTLLSDELYLLQEPQATAQLYKMLGKNVHRYLNPDAIQYSINCLGQIFPPTCRLLVGPGGTWSMNTAGSATPQPMLWTARLNAERSTLPLLTEP